MARFTGRVDTISDICRRLQMDLVREIFVNSQICMVQRVYPTREDSDQVRVFASDGSIVVSDIMKWEMDATNPW
jgi:hypothetical protein